MKKTHLILVITFLILCTSSQSKTIAYPSYKEVVRQFFMKYDANDRPNKYGLTDEIKFEKKPTGWHVVVMDYSKKPNEIKDELFWDSKKNKYRKLSFKELEVKPESEEYSNQFLKLWNTRLFIISPYYGYPGWDWDVINDFKDEGNLSDTLLYALGRAYSSYASNLINSNSGFADTNHQFTLPEGKNCMTDEQLKKYRFYRHKGIEKFSELAKRNPEFNTIVGSIGIKASNEHMTAFLDLRTFQNEMQASKELVDGLYNDFYISTAKNYLNSCEPNGILFTNGDNDTYPLLYVQAKQGFRTDVLVVNLSLLNTNRYINSFREKTLDAPALPLSFTASDIKSMVDYVYLKKDDENDIPMKLEDFISYIRNNQNSDSSKTSNPLSINTKNFIYQYDEDKLEFTISNSYIIKSKIMTLDIINANKWKRPIYFATTTGKDSYIGLSDYFSLQGLAYKLTSTKKDNADNNIGFVNSTELYNQIINQFDWSGIKNLSQDEANICINHRNTFHRLAEKLIDENKNDSANVVLDKCFELFPDDIVAFDYYTIPLMEDYYELGEVEKANNIAKLLIFNLKNNTNNRYDLTTESGRNQKLAVNYRLEQTFKKYEQEELLKDLEE
ncbi:MAG: hypothetical protein K9J13_17690 [Saprospiraceae bacterium]|nr:hypothetical protein [Saprospiraceae bacterium]